MKHGCISRGLIFRKRNIATRRRKSACTIDSAIAERMRVLLGNLRESRAWIRAYIRTKADFETWIRDATMQPVTMMNTTQSYLGNLSVSSSSDDQQLDNNWEYPLCKFDYEQEPLNTSSDEFNLTSTTTTEIGKFAWLV